MITVIENKYQEDNVGADSGRSVGEYFADIIADPVECKKDDAQGIIFAEFKQPYSTRTIANVVEVDDQFFGIDVDNKPEDPNCTIEEFKEQFSEFEYYLYTTSSHTEERNRYRVIMRGCTPRYDILNKASKGAFKDYMMERLPFTDRSTLTPVSVFYEPLVTDNYYSYSNSGVPMEFLDWVEPIIEEPVVINKKYSLKVKAPYRTYEECMQQAPISDFLADRSSEGQDSMFYQALCSALSIKACQEIRDDLEAHAVRCRWSRKEIQHKIEYAEDFTGRKW